VVWVHGTTGTEECPKSLIRPESVELVEKYFAWKMHGGAGWMDLMAREADAFQLLDEEWRTEVKNGE
jgi:hypothetical protein